MENYLSKALEGDRLAIGRLLTYIERDPKRAGEILSKLPQRDGYHVIGITGISGSGKSTLLSQLLTYYSDLDIKCAVVAIDPSSSFSKGAFLGDRIRMQMHATNPNIFIRSVSTRGLKGGLSFAGVAMVDVFGRLGYDKVFIESIGVGQADIDIMGIAHTILVVTVPGLGDDIQALKAGVMEIGDIYIINKVDKDPEEANKSYEYLKFAVESGEIGKEAWIPRILKVSAVMGLGIDKLVETMDEHLNYLMNTKKYWDKQVIRSKVLVRLLAEKMVLDVIDDLPLPERYDNIYLEARNILKKVMDYIGNGVNHPQQDY